MDRNRKRFTIYVPNELSQDLAAVKADAYQTRSQAEMLRDLIARGLQESQRRSSGGR